MVVQIPIFYALYLTLQYSVELQGAPFMLWITDLSKKDPYYVLPILMGVSMLVQQKMTPTVGDPRQAQIMMIMPVVFTFMFLEFPTGLGALLVRQQRADDRAAVSDRPELGAVPGGRRADGHGRPQGRGGVPRRPGVAGDPWDELRAATAALDLGLPPDFETQARALSGRPRALGADRPPDGLREPGPAGAAPPGRVPHAAPRGAAARARRCSTSAAAPGSRA